MPLDFDDPVAQVKVTRNVIMISDSSSGWRTGIASINQSLASELSSFDDVAVYCIILTTSDKTDQVFDEANSTSIDCETGKSVPVHLVHVNLMSTFELALSESDILMPPRPSLIFKNFKTETDGTDEPSVQNLRYALARFNDSTLEMLATSRNANKLPANAAFIVGHAPVTAAAALLMRETMYPESEVILFYHIIPEEHTWAANSLPCRIPDTEEMIRMAETADVIFSVTSPVHEYFAARFRHSSARVAIDHRLIMPLCHKNIFDINGSALRSLSEKKACYCIAVFLSSGVVEDWMGIDIAICAVGKVAKALACRRRHLTVTGSSEYLAPRVHLAVLNIDHSKFISVQTALQAIIDIAEERGACIDLVIQPSDPWQAGPYRQLTNGPSYDLCLFPTRSEPYGQVGLEPISAAMPTLLSQSSTLASMIRRFTPDSSNLFVETTRDVNFYRQDASGWSRRILYVIDNPRRIGEQALVLQGAIKRDESIRVTRDEFLRYCLGGIGIQFQLTQLQFISPSSKAELLAHGESEDARELASQRRFEKFLLNVIHQCWRVKRHPLQTIDELPVLLETMSRLPVCPMVVTVINALENNGRRIVAVDRRNGALVVHCPTMSSLRNLWASCTAINAAMRSILLPRSLDFSVNPVMTEHGLRRAETRAFISGSEFLSYSEHLEALVNKE